MRFSYEWPIHLDAAFRPRRRCGFLAAARKMGVKQPTASRIAAALERQVGAAPQTRGAPAVTLTEADADYLARPGDPRRS